MKTDPFKLDDLTGVCLLQSLDYVSQNAKICMVLTPCFGAGFRSLVVLHWFCL